MQKQIDMTSGPIFPSLLRFALPIIISSVLQVSYGAADTFIVGRYDDPLSMGAVGSAGTITGCIVNLFLGMSVGVNILSARFMGAKDFANVKKCGFGSLFIGFFFGIIMLVLGQLFSESLVDLVGIAPEIKLKTITYIRVYTLGMPFSAITNFISAYLQGIGNVKSPTRALIISGAVNVIMNIILVKNFSMGVVGVALATVISQVVAFLIIMFVFVKNEDIKVNLKSLNFDFNILKNILFIGLPVGLQSLLNNISHVFTTSAMNSFGAAAVSGEKIELQVESLLVVGVSAVGIAVMTFVSQNLGAKNYKRIDRIFKSSFIVTVVYCLISSLLAYIFRHPLVNLFSTDNLEVAKYALIKFDFVILPFFTIAVQEIPANMLKGIGETTWVMIITFIINCVFRIFWILVILPLNNTMGTLFISYPIAWLIAGVCFSVLYKIKRDKFPDRQIS